MRSVWKTRWPSVALMASDAIGYGACWLLAWAVRYGLNPIAGPVNSVESYLRVMPLIVVLGVMNAAMFGLYMQQRRLASLNRPGVLIKASYHWLLYILVLGFFFRELDLARLVMVLCGMLGFAYLYASRSALRWLKQQAINAGAGTMRCAVVGSGELAKQVTASLRDHPEVGFSFVGLVIPEGEAAPADFIAPIIGTTREVPDLIARHGIEEIFLAVGDLMPEQQLNLLDVSARPGVSVHIVSNIFGVISERAKADEIATFPVITLRDGNRPLHEAMLKRGLDLACAVFGIAAWWLLFHPWIAWWIRRDSAGPVFFSQERVGMDGKVFTMWKYRTMHVDARQYDIAPTSEADPRVTKFGAWLRHTSLDELPQLLNVLLGEMSIVGPRPEMPFLAEKWEAWQRRRLDVKPGVTGLWQVIGRKNLPLHLNIQYDFYYIRNQSFLLDLEILIRTIPAVLKGRGAF